MRISRDDDAQRAKAQRRRSPAALESFLSVKEVAEICQVSTKTVRRWIEGGELAAHRFGRQLRIAPADLEVFVKLRRKL